MRALVIGADGFAGRWLVKHLAESGDTVVAAAGPGFKPPLPFADEALSVDVRDAAAVEAVVASSRPDITYYLAGVSQQGRRDALPIAAQTSIFGSVNALVALAQHVPGSRLLFVSSGFGYGSSPDTQDESAPASPDEVYGSAKLAAEFVLGQLARVANVQVVVARPF